MVQFLDELPRDRSRELRARPRSGRRCSSWPATAPSGAHPYFTPPEHTAYARPVLGPQPLLVPELAAALDAGRRGAAAARAYAKRYLEMPNYTQQPQAARLHRRGLRHAGSDRLMSAVVPHGPAAVADRLREHLDAGADHVVVQPVGADGRFAADSIGELASIAAGLPR